MALKDRVFNWQDFQAHAPCCDVVRLARLYKLPADWSGTLTEVLAVDTRPANKIWCVLANVSDLKKREFMRLVLVECKAELGLVDTDVDDAESLLAGYVANVKNDSDLDTREPLIEKKRVTTWKAYLADRTNTAKKKTAYFYGALWFTFQTRAPARLCTTATHDASKVIGYPRIMELLTIFLDDHD